MVSPPWDRFRCLNLVVILCWSSCCVCVRVRVRCRDVCRLDSPVSCDMHTCMHAGILWTQPKESLDRKSSSGFRITGLFVCVCRLWAKPVFYRKSAEIHLFHLQKTSTMILRENVHPNTPRSFIYLLLTEIVSFGKILLNFPGHGK